jgi:hypothetical protein
MCERDTRVHKTIEHIYNTPINGSYKGASNQRENPLSQPVLTRQQDQVEDCCFTLRVVDGSSSCSHVPHPPSIPLCYLGRRGRRNLPRDNDAVRMAPRPATTHHQLPPIPPGQLARAPVATRPPASIERFVASRRRRRRARSQPALHPSNSNGRRLLHRRIDRGPGVVPSWPRERRGPVALARPRKKPVGAAGRP